MDTNDLSAQLHEGERRKTKGANPRKKKVWYLLAYMYLFNFIHDLHASCILNLETQVLLLSSRT